MTDRPNYLPTWVQPGDFDPSTDTAWIVYDEREGFQPAYALVFAPNATDAVDEAEDLSDNRLSSDSDTLVLELVWGTER